MFLGWDLGVSIALWGILFLKDRGKAMGESKANGSSVKIAGFVEWRVPKTT